MSLLFLKSNWLKIVKIPKEAYLGVANSVPLLYIKTFRKKCKAVQSQVFGLLTKTKECIILG